MPALGGVEAVFLGASWLEGYRGAQRQMSWHGSNWQLEEREASCEGVRAGLGRVQGAGKGPREQVDQLCSLGGKVAVGAWPVLHWLHSPPGGLGWARSVSCVQPVPVDIC